MDEAMADLTELDRAANDGAWIAGYLTYDFGAAMHGVPPPNDRPLFALGTYEAPIEPAANAEREATISPLRPTIDRTVYERAIAAIHRAIYDGDVYQVNYTVPFDVDFDGDAESLWRAIARETNAPFQAYVEDGERRILSWSPELFLSFDGKKISTRPMKGTAPLDSPDELRNAKNRAEHVMIVDLLSNDLHRIADDVTVEAFLTTERYPTFLTMTSTISGIVRESSSLAGILRATFPCGSVTGAPKRAAIQHIAKLESRPRGVYCGSIGFLSPQRTGWWNVAIRTAQFESTAGRFDTGGGIVAESDAGNEWGELHLKAQFLKSNSAPLEFLEAFAARASPATRAAHLERLASTAVAFDVAFDRHALEDALAAFCKVHSDGIVRVRVAPGGTFRFLHDSFGTTAEQVPICIAPQPVSSNDVFLRYKTSWRPAHDAAFRYATGHGCFEALLQNERDELTEGSRTNLFVTIDGSLWTPPLECGLLPGILRSKLVSEGRARERILTRNDVANAQEVFVGNSARGLLRARLIESKNE